MNDLDKDIEERLKSAESGIFWCNIFLILLCVGMASWAWYIWKFIDAQILFNEGVVKIFDSLKVK